MAGTSAGSSADTIDEATAAALVPLRDPRGHKATFGRVSIVAGSPTYAGAALLAGLGALRGGAGLVTLLVPDTIAGGLLGRVPELILVGLPTDDDGELDARAAVDVVADRAHDALVIGPGLAAGRGTATTVRRLLAIEGPPAVVDATGLDALAAAPGWWERLARPIVLTPHPGELRRLGQEPGADGAERLAAAEGAAARFGSVVVLKGAETVVARPDGASAVSPFVVPALATAGTGDVLAGVTGALIAQRLGPFDAARLAVYLHGRAGEHVSERIGDAGTIATDLLPEVPRVRRHLAAIVERGPSTVGFGEPGPASGT